MKPQDDHRNGDGTASSASRSDDSEGEEASALEEALSLEDEAAPARALAALNALRKARQHYDVVLAVGGEELPAHRAVLAAASPRLLAALASAPRALRLPALDADAVRELLEYAYTGRLRVRDLAAARRLYRAAARLRLEPARAHLAARLVAHALAAAPSAAADCLAVLALPALRPHHRAQLDAAVAAALPRLCASGALAALPVVHIEMLRETSADGGEEAPAAVADAALAWLRDCHAPDVTLEELCGRTHLVFVDAGGALRDCGELPAASGDAPELREYRREAQERTREPRRREPRAPSAPLPAAAAAIAPPEYTLAEEDDENGGECRVIAARAEESGGGGGGGGSGAVAVVALRGRLCVARVSWRAGSAEGPRGGRLGGARGADAEAEGEEGAEGARLASMSVGRCAAGAAALDGRLVVCGGYDRARVLRGAEAFDPRRNEWAALADMKRARARFPAVALHGAVYVLGGSDGLNELDSVDVYEASGGGGGGGGGAWRGRARLPAARSHAAAAADAARGVLYVLGGWAAGRSLRAVHKYSPASDAWTDAPPLTIGRSQSAGVVWEGALWALGGTDGWNCLASTEFLSLGEAGEAGEAGATWAPGPALPTARRSVGGAEWRGALVAAGGSGGAASLRRVDWLRPDGCGGAAAAAWRALPALRRPRAAPSLAALGAALYAAGGFSGKEFLSCVECLTDPEGQWTTLWSEPAPPPTLANHSQCAHPQSDQAQSDQAQSDQAQSDQAQSDQAQSDQAQSDQAQSDQAQSDQVQSDQTQSDQTQSDQTQCERPTAQQAAPQPRDARRVREVKENGTAAQ